MPIKEVVKIDPEPTVEIEEVGRRFCLSEKARYVCSTANG